MKTLAVLILAALLCSAVLPAQSGGLPPEGLFYMWLIWGQFHGYDWRNCEMSDSVPGFEGVAIVQCWGPPLPPESADYRPYSSIRSRAAGRR